MLKSIKAREHGPVQTYWAGCRCDKCREGNRLYYRNYVATPKGREASKRSSLKWRNSPEGKADQRRRDLHRYFKLTPDDYQKMLDQQGGVCAICKGTDAYRLAVDHDHNTGKIRGLLCGNCNTGLGKFRDNPELLQAAINYIL